MVHHETCICAACGGKVKRPRAPKFIQIVSTASGLMALAGDGTVWVLVNNPYKGWKPLPMGQVIE